MGVAVSRTMTAMAALLAAAGAWAAGANAAKSPVLAQIGAASISGRDLEAFAAADLARETRDFESAKRLLESHHAQRIQAQREAALDRMIDEKVLSLEAAAQQTTPQKLLENVAVPGARPDEIRAYYITHQEDFNQPLSEVAATIEDLLKQPAGERERAAYVRGLRQKYQVAVTFQPHREQLSNSGPVRGLESSSITLVEYSDFQCPDCRRFQYALAKALDVYRGTVRLEFRHLPRTDRNANAQGAAEAAVCAQRQGKFWEMHDAMYKEQSRLGRDQLQEKAKRLGLDTVAFADCLERGAAREAVAADVRSAEALGVVEAPTLFVNGRFVEGAVSESQLFSLIEAELARQEHAAPR